MSNMRNEKFPPELWEHVMLEPSKLERYMAVATVTIIVYSLVIMTAVELARVLAW